jgi:hypothetical protein
MATSETIQTFLTQYSWEYEVLEDNLLVTGFRGKANAFRIFVQVVDTWVILMIVPFVPRPTTECQARFWPFLLRLNYEMNLAKVGCDPEGDVMLSVEMRSPDLCFADFQEGLNVLSYYADVCYLPLTNLAVDPAYPIPELPELLGGSDKTQIEDSQ